MEASDGSRQVKVWLHCPCCRSDLTYSIRDTLLLRKVDELEHLLRDGSDNIVLTDAQRRLMDALERSQEVQNAVDESRRREANYLGLPLLDPEQNDSESSTSFEEWGVEADLIRGVHDSFHSPKAPLLNVEKSRITEKQIDTTLFSGLDMFLTADCDRIDLTKLMTSGDPNGLAEGAQILAEVAKSIQTPEIALKNPSSKSHTRHQYFLRHSSVYELVAEAKEAHQTEENEKCGIFPPLPPRQNGLRQPSTSVIREVRRDVKRMAEHQKKFPLPVRMPKYIVIDPATKNQIRFVDNTWDGTVIDAYSKLSIGLDESVSQRKATHDGVRNILGGVEVRIDFPNQPRVLLASVTQEMGRQGATKGDVVTHIQERDISGQTVAEFQKLLTQTDPDPVSGKISLVLNAEKSVAEALKRRSTVMAEQTIQ